MIRDMRHLCLALAVAPTLTLADCPPAPDHSQAVADLLTALQEAPNETVGRTLAQELWTYWTDAPDEAAQALLERGFTERSGLNFLASRQTFDRLVAYCPDYAEGWNQRAYASFLMGDYPAALRDLDRALELDPVHVAALAGKALALRELGRREEAYETLLAALALNPWLPERALLQELAPPGDEI